VTVPIFPMIARYQDLSSDAAALLRAALVIDTLAAGDLAVALDTDIADIDQRLATLAAREWVEPGPGGGMVWRDAPRMWLTWDAPGHLEPAVLHADDLAVAARYLDHHLTALTHPDRDHAAEWLTAHHATLLAAINAGVRAGLADRVIAVARAAWTVTKVPDQAWHLSLIRTAEPAARDDRELLGLTRHSADHLLRTGDLYTAEHQYGRAAALAFGLPDHHAAADALTVLVRVLCDRDQAPRAVDTLIELADLHQRMGDTLAFAATLVDIGEITLTGNRPGLAHTYTTHAITTLSENPDSPPNLLARAHELHGHTLRALGNPILARRAFHIALTHVDSGEDGGVDGGVDGHTVTRERLDTAIHRKRPHRGRPASPDTTASAER
jgi:hypothetical protein